MLSIDVITSIHHLNSLAMHWQQLYDHAGCRLPFLQLSWIQLWWKSFGKSGRFVRNQCMILAVKDGSRLTGILPLYKTTYGFGPTAGFQYVRPLGSDANITELQTALLLPGEERATLGAVGRYFADRSGDWDLLNWGSFADVVEPSTLIAGQSASFDRRPPVELFLLHLPATWEEFVAPLRRNTKEAIRKAHNALKRDGLEAELQVFEAPDDILAHLPRFFELHSRRAEFDGAISHPDVFRDAHHRSFLVRIVETMGAEGTVRLFALKVHGEIVALRLGFVIKDTLYFYYSGFDPAYAKYSVMTRLIVEVIKWSMQAGIATINLSSGRDRSKMRWNPDIVSYRNYCQVGQRWRSRAAFAAINKIYRSAAYEL